MKTFVRLILDFWVVFWIYHTKKKIGEEYDVVPSLKADDLNSANGEE